MGKESILFAKLAGLQKNFASLEWGRGRILGTQIEHLIEQYFQLESQFKEELPELYSDLPSINKLEATGKGCGGANIFDYSDVAPVIQNIDYILEVRSNQRIGEQKEEETKKHRIFISHGTSTEWHKVQATFGALQRELKVLTR